MFNRIARGGSQSLGAESALQMLVDASEFISDANGTLRYTFPRVALMED